MNADALSALSKHIRDETYFYWVADNFSHWTTSGLIPVNLLEPSSVLELHDFLLENQNILLKNMKTSNFQ